MPLCENQCGSDVKFAKRHWTVESSCPDNDNVCPFATLVTSLESWENFWQPKKEALTPDFWRVAVSVPLYENVSLCASFEYM